MNQDWPWRPLTEFDWTYIIHWGRHYHTYIYANIQAHTHILTYVHTHVRLTYMHIIIYIHNSSIYIHKICMWPNLSWIILLVTRHKFKKHLKKKENISNCVIVSFLLQTPCTVNVNDYIPLINQTWISHYEIDLYVHSCLLS